MTRTFDAYAKYYDLLYGDKDYTAEAEYVAFRIRNVHPGAKSILELGSGTGGHAEHLAKMGFIVHGVDLSGSMVIRARTRLSALPLEVAGRLSFSEDDIRSARPQGPFDAVVSLFHVVSYLTSNADLEATLETAYRSLLPEGLLFFDFWYGPAVLLQKPEVRIRRLEDDRVRVTRISEPVMHITRNVVDVRFTVFVEEKSSGAVTEIRETHPMRYYFLPELQQLSASRFEWVDACAWKTVREPGGEDWAGCVLLRRRC